MLSTRKSPGGEGGLEGGLKVPPKMEPPSSNQIWSGLSASGMKVLSSFGAREGEGSTFESTFDTPSPTPAGIFCNFRVEFYTVINLERYQGKVLPEIVPPPPSTEYKFISTANSPQ